MNGDRIVTMCFVLQSQGPTAGPRETLPSATPIAAEVDHIFKVSASYFRRAFALLHDFKSLCSSFKGDK